MAVKPEGTPVWADAMFTDIEGAKSFYGDVLGWTFGEESSEYGNYTQANANGKAAAAVVPPMPGQEGQSQWCLYFASPDAAATAARIRENGGEVLMEPMAVGDFGSMCLARDPGGVVFGVWQAGTHEGFDAEMREPGAFCWAEIFTHEPEKSDTFFPAVFGYGQQQMEDDAIDFRLYTLGGETMALGRMRMTDDFPSDVPPWINVYFNVPDCDDAVAKATKLGAVLRFGPMSSPFGRFAALSDPQGANFSVIDTSTTEGDMPKLSDVS
ncbi:hydrolase [Streptomyces viridochromogenes]|uniref:Hydrolase n=1 Tax=Streptomyces viridochromogenes TaxID=1938 RepID=A0A0J7ZFC2_STRVR|nr:VOC family protein [Streptomyces viridochromogenes]KMS73913.1 hydrolase [Streptomyces viridochromogenes]KOG10984.1 hydrolase [Streptomyces viridochromogenes]KOG26079.1 hydrolase [Streptomyces viridochromogenes]